MLRRFALAAGSPRPGPPPRHGRVIVRHWRSETLVVNRDSASLRIVLAGEERLEIDGRPYRLTGGQMMLVPTGAPMRVRSSGDGHGLSIDLPDHAPDLPGAMLLPLTSHPIGGWLADLSAQLIEDGDNAHDAATLTLRDVHDQVAALIDACSGRMARIDAVKPVTRRDLLCRIEAARDLLTSTTHRAVPLWELAEHARLSPFHLSRAFRASTGRSPTAYHRMVRMEAAAARLAAGERPAQVAIAMGFADQAGFSRAFVRHHGVPPGRYAARNYG